VSSLIEYTKSERERQTKKKYFASIIQSVGSVNRLKVVDNMQSSGWKFLHKETFVHSGEIIESEIKFN
jgi:hypothetical protein